MTRPTTGPAPQIIAQALELQIMCRPTHSTRVGVGEALAVSRDLFWLVSGQDGTFVAFRVSPEELMQDWTLTTNDLIRAEWQKETSVPW